MFCGECGTKNEAGSNFCENCGAKLENKEKNPMFSNMSKQNKTVLKIASGVIAVIIIAFIVLSNMFKPENIAKKFFEATVDGDTDKIYNYLNIEDGKFTSKKMFSKVFKEKLKENSSEVLNYKVTKVNKSEDGLKMDVTISYTEKDKSLPKTTEITLKKNKKNKLLFFSNWIISSEDFVTERPVKIVVAKGTELTIEGIKLDKKYLDKNESDEDEEVYELPKMLTGEYTVKAKLPVGFVVEDKLNINNYYSEYDIKIDSSNIPKKTSKKIEKTIKENLKTMYDAAINKKSFDEIKNKFDYKKADLKEIEEDYNTLVSNLSNSSSTLTSIDFTNAEIVSFSFDDNEIKVRTRIKYKYEIKYKDYNDEEKTNKSSDYDYLTISFDCVDGDYKMIDTTTLTTYFSRYN